MCGTRGGARGVGGRRSVWWGSKTNDDIFATNVCSKEKEKASKKANIPALPSSTSRAAFRVGGGGLGKHNTHRRTHKRGTVGETEGRRYRWKKYILRGSM